MYCTMCAVNRAHSNWSSCSVQTLARQRATAETAVCLYHVSKLVQLSRRSLNFVPRLPEVDFARQG